MRLVPFLFIGCFFFVLVGCKQRFPTKPPVEAKVVDSVAFIQIPQFPPINDVEVRLTPASTSEVSFSISPGEYDFSSYDALVSGIVSPEMSDKEKAFKLWKFVSNQVYNCIPAVRKRQIYDPLKMLNSFGCGVCGGINATLANLDSVAGLRSRVFSLGGHVVSEVYYNNGWHMFDADQNVYFTDSTGEVASLDYVNSHPELFVSGKNKLRNYGALPFVNYLMKRIYTTRHNNMVSDVYKDIAFDYCSGLTLQEGDEIRFTISKLRNFERLSHFFSTHSVSQYSRKGALKRSSFKTVDLNSPEEIIIHESLPYAAQNISVKRNTGRATGFSAVTVYFSPDGGKWYFKGVLGNSISQISFTPFISSSENIAFNYYLRFVATNKEISKEELRSITVENRILFSDKIFLNKSNSFCVKRTDSKKFPVDVKMYTD